MKTAWTLRIERLRLELAVGLHSHELRPQPVWVNVEAEGHLSALPDDDEPGLEPEALMDWLTRTWPASAHVPRLETRLHQLLDAVYGLDPRIHAVRVGLYKQRAGRGAHAVGLERRTTRNEFEAQRRQVERRGGQEARAPGQPSTGLAPIHLSHLTRSPDDVSPVH